MGVRNLGAAAINKVRAGVSHVRGKLGPHYGKAKGYIKARKKRFMIGGAAAGVAGAGAVAYRRRKKK